ncbi:Hypothetical predicted protein [Mytilus galloprovincialis]|uniref:Death domain-containing protein n=1 Tax=Mytilus galloprovincialis TaxID=29158 RepID=A0A8B6GK01_MYTGA|nr:Hypothetical predicted protein [Mytilus galloprovincialis]
MLQENDGPLVKDNNTKQRQASKEIRKKKRKIKSKDHDIHFMTATNEIELEGEQAFNFNGNNLNHDTVSDQTNQRSSASPSKVLNCIDNSGNENSDLNRKDSNKERQVLTQGDETLNVTNKQEVSFNNTIVNKVVDTSVKQSEEYSHDSYSSSFESSDGEGDKWSAPENKPVQQGNKKKVSEKIVPCENKKNKNTSERTGIEKSQEEPPSTSTPRKDLDQQEHSESYAYSNTFETDSNTKVQSKKVSDPENQNGNADATLSESSWPSYCQDNKDIENKETQINSKTATEISNKKTGKSGDVKNTNVKKQSKDNSDINKDKDDDDDATLTESSWPSYCEDKNNQEVGIEDKKHIHVEDSKNQNIKSSDHSVNSLSDKKSDQNEISVKDHSQISVSFSENSKHKCAGVDKEDSDKKKEEESDDATLSDNSFPTYRSEDPVVINSGDTPEDKGSKIKVSTAKDSASDKSKNNDSVVSLLYKSENCEEIKQKPPIDTKTLLSDTLTDAQRESQNRKNKETRKNSSPDDTLEDIEPISNIDAPLPIDTDKTNCKALINKDNKPMARQKFVRQAVKNSESDVETEKMEGTNTTKASEEQPVHLTNGDDGVFSEESDIEGKEHIDRDDDEELTNVTESNSRQRNVSDWGTNEDFKKEHETGGENNKDKIENDQDKNKNTENSPEQAVDSEVPTDDKIQDNGKDHTQAREVGQKSDDARKNDQNVDGVGVESVEQIRRNIKIDNAVETVAELEVKAQDLMENMKDLMSEYTTRLNNQPLSDFVMDLDKFKGDFVSLRDAYKKYESLFVFLNKCLKDLRSSGDEVNNLIAKRFREEDLTTWMESQEKFEEEKHKIREERIAVERSALAKASEARASIAKATIAVAESTQLANETEIEAAEAESLAKKAWESAEVALKAAEEARKAAIEKRKADDEARKRAQERAEKKAEEERKIREVEDKGLMEEAKKKGTTFQDERKRADEEKARKEAERINPNNWPRYIYSVDPGDYDPGVGVIIRSIKGSLNREDVEVTRLDQDTGVLELTETEELVSNIIEIKPTDNEKKFSFEQAMSIAIPQCAPRGIPGKEAVIKCLQSNGKWAELPSTELVLNDIKELRFVETRTRKFGTYVVMNTNINIEVQPVELSAVTELKQRSPGECNNLLAASPILKFSIPNRKFAKPLLMTLPLPPNTTRPKRPQTAMATNRSDSDSGQDARPLTARPSTAFQSSRNEDESEEDIHLLVRSNREETWTKLQDVPLFQARNKDIVSFEIKEPSDRYLILRTKEGMTVTQVERIAFMLEISIMYRTIQIFLRQKNDDPNEVIVSCEQSNRAERAIRKFGELGYEEGPNPSKDIIVKEGQILDISFRGNIQCTKETDKLRLVFNTHFRSRLDFSVEEIEKFAQKSFHTYRGFAQVSSDVVHKKLHIMEHQTPGAPKKPPHIEVTKERQLLTELLINIPKPDPEPPQPLNTAPVKIHVEAPNTKDVLEFVANELGDEWKMLAQVLNLKSVRIQAILRQNTANPDPKKIRYDMLVSWAKRIPRSANKLDILATALTSCGRSDIASELRDKDLEYKRNMAKANKNTLLKRAFVKVAQNPDAVKNWMIIARRLGVAEDQLRTIDQSKPSVQEKCFNSLQIWQSVVGEQASVHQLTDRLRKCRYRQLARKFNHQFSDSMQYSTVLIYY